MKQYFKYAHLPAHLQAISKPFCDAADNLTPSTIIGLIAAVKKMPSKDAAETAQCLKKLEAAKKTNGETALRLLLEAKDCAVRAAV